MFGVAPIRTRADYTDAAPAGLPPRPNVELGAESALLRTRSLLDSTSKQHKYIISNYRLAADVRTDELAALLLLRSHLEELESCILENDNPPQSASKRKTLIKVEKARRGVLAAVRECAGHVTESQKLCEEIERFTELRPDEPVSPRNFNVKWTRKAPLSRHLARRRDQGQGRSMRPADSLVMSIVGLSAIAEGRERHTPTADAAAPAAAPPPAALGQKAQLPAAALRVQEPAKQRDPDGADRHRNIISNAAAAATGSAVTGVQEPQGRGLTAASQVIKDATLLLQRMQLQQQQPVRRTTDDSVDVENDLRPSSLTHEDVAPSSATTMCNMDSCVSGPPQRAMASGAGDAGCEAADSNLRSYGGYEDGDEDEDEVNSAEGRCYDAGSPEHKVSLLGCARTAAASAAAATTRSTASTPPHPHPQGLQAQQPQARVSGAGSAGMVAAPSTVAVLEVAMRSQESLTSNRSYQGAESRCRASATNTPMTAAVAVPPPSRAIGAAVAVASSGDGAFPQVLLTEGSQADAAAAELDAIGLVAAAHPPPLPPLLRYGMTRQQAAAAAPPLALPPQYPSSAVHPHPHPPAQPDRGPADAASMALPGPYLTAMGHHPVASPYSQHPAHAAAVAAAAAHPYGANGYSHPPHHLLHVATNPHPAYAAAAAPQAQPTQNLGPHSLPPSVPSSLRDFPVTGPAARVVTAGGSGGGAAAPGGGPRYGASQPASGHQSLDSGQFPASATAWDNVSLADTEPLPGAPGRQGRRGGRRRGGGLLGLMRNVVGFGVVSMLSGAAMVLGAAAVNTGLDEQEATQQARKRQGSGRRGQQRLGRGGDDLIPQRTLQQLRSPDLLALGRG